MSLIGDLFGHSPIRPMQEHMRAAVECARQILPLFEEMVAGDMAAVAARHQQIDRLEHEADRIKNEIRSHLPKRMFLAVERRDMLEILDYQDSIADVARISPSSTTCGAWSSPRSSPRRFLIWFAAR